MLKKFTNPRSGFLSSWRKVGSIPGGHPSLHAFYISGSFDSPPARPPSAPEKWSLIPDIGNYLWSAPSALLSSCLARTGRLGHDVNLAEFLASPPCTVFKALQDDPLPYFFLLRFEKFGDGYLFQRAEERFALIVNSICLRSGRRSLFSFLGQN